MMEKNRILNSFVSGIIMFAMVFSSFASIPNLTFATEEDFFQENISSDDNLNLHDDNINLNNNSSHDVNQEQEEILDLDDEDNIDSLELEADTIGYDANREEIDTHDTFENLRLHNNSCNTTLYSDTSDIIVSNGLNAVATYSSHPYWTASIPGATWIWKTFFVTNPTIDEFVTFEKKFNIPNEVFSGNLIVAADNSYKVYINDVKIGEDNEEANYFDKNKDIYNVASYIKVGENKIIFEVKNWAQKNGTKETNPAGLLYKLDINHKCGSSVVNTPPKINLIGNNPFFVMVGDIFTDPGATATDAQDGDLTSSIVKTGNVNTSIVGTTTLVYSVTDSGGLSASTTRVVVVKPKVIPPVNPVNICKEIIGKNGWYGKYYDYHSSHSDMEEPIATWNKYYGDPLSNKGYWTTDWYDEKYFKMSRIDKDLLFGDKFFPLDSISGAEILKGHNYHFGVHWKAIVTATSSAGYSFRLDSDDDAWVYVDGVLVADNRGVHPVVSTTSSVYLSKGDHIVDIFFAERHTTESNMYFRFKDPSLIIKPFIDGCININTPPVITLVGSNPMTLSVGDIFTDPGATATDAQDGDLTSSIVKTGNVNTSIVGTTTLVYSVTDSGGLSASTTRVVVVKPKVIPPPNGGPVNTPPVITLIGENPFYVYIGSNFTDPGATATDAQDGDLTSSIIVSGTVATSTIGTSTLTYSVYDSGGLGATTTREVVVLSTTTTPVIKPQCSDGLDNDGDGKIDSLDPGCHSDGDVENDSSFDPNDDSEIDVLLNPPSNGGGGGSNEGGGSSLSGRRRDISNLLSTSGEILGASSCSYLRDYLRIDWANDRIEVLKLQSFLNIYEGASLVLTGVFDTQTLESVNNFQNKYKNDILTPWGHDAPTGFVYILTKKKINEIYCNTIYPLTNEQQKEIEDFRSFLESIKTNNQSANYDLSGIGGDFEGALSGVAINKDGEVVIDLQSTTTTEKEVDEESLSNSVLKNAAVSIFAVPSSLFEATRCLIAFLILLFVIYIVSGILAEGTRPRRIAFITLGITAMIISILIKFYCVVLPTLVMAIIALLLILFDKDDDNNAINAVLPFGNSGNKDNKDNNVPENLPAEKEKEDVSEIVVDSEEEEIIELPASTESKK